RALILNHAHGPAPARPPQKPFVNFSSQIARRTLREPKFDSPGLEAHNMDIGLKLRCQEHVALGAGARHDILELGKNWRRLRLRLWMDGLQRERSYARAANGGWSGRGRRR